MSSYIPTQEEKERFMARAIELSIEGASKGFGGPYGCVIVKDGKTVGEGFNRVFVDCDPSAHGEMVAIRNAGKNLKTYDLLGCSLYTNFEPCPMCTAAIWWSRLDQVYYAQPVKGSTNHHDENQATVLKFVTTSIDERSIPGEQVESKSKEALDAIKKYLNADTKKV
ncbi:guanine deaminase-like [Oculina patagonica]